MGYLRRVGIFGSLELGIRTLESLARMSMRSGVNLKIHLKETIGWMVNRGHSISHSLLRTSKVSKRVGPLGTFGAGGLIWAIREPRLHFEEWRSVLELVPFSGWFKVGFAIVVLVFLESRKSVQLCLKRNLLVAGSATFLGY